MTDLGLISLFLFLHVGAAIIAFGPTFAFPIIGSFAAKEPMHGNFAARINEAIEDRIVIPFALSMPVTGVLLIYFAKFNLTDRSAWWLGIAIVLYIIAIYVAVVLQRPLVHKLVALTTRPPAGAPAGATAPAGGPAGGPPAGPPPELPATARAVQRNGMILGVLLVLIVVLMVVKPQF
jgi:hypothetical protein